MKPARANLTGGLLLAVVAAATTWAATFAWRGFSESSSLYLGPLLVLGLVVAGTGALARWWRLPGSLVFLSQIALSGMLACLMLTGSPLPVGPAYAELVASFSDAVASANGYAAPVPDGVPGIHPLLVAGGLACMLLVDLLVCTLRRVPLAGLPLLAVYSVPVSLLDASISWWVFVATAVGFMSLLYLHESEQVSRWGRPLAQQLETDTGRNVRPGAVRTSAGAIGGVATALALVVPLVIPTLDVTLFDFGKGPGGDNEITIKNPMADLQRDLKQGPDVPLIRVATDDPSPDHLRIAALTRFSQNEWSSGDREVPTDNLPTGAMPALQGVLPSVPRRTYDYRVDITENFDSTWLPTQAPISSIVASGDWRFDPKTMDFIAGPDEDSVAGLDYSMTAVELDLQAAEMAASGSAVNQDNQEFLELPSGLPSLVTNLAAGVTEQATTKFEKAQALQQWFRESGGFTYDLARSDEGNGVDELEAFLDEDGGRVGYCEQFAASMAVMARVLEIPSRVAIGFLTPERVGAGVYEYSSRDLHAWPELYFPGAGWVLFEPTPSDRVRQVPAYTTENVPVAPNPQIPSASASDAVPDRTTGSASASASPEDAAARADAGDGGTAFPWLRVLAIFAGLALLAAIALAPQLLRQRVRLRRLSAGPELAWAELRAEARDLGLAWPHSRSPRETRDWLVTHFGAPEQDGVERPAHGSDLAPDAVAALDRIVSRLEELRYARGHTDGHSSLSTDVRVCVAALRWGCSPRVRRTAHWWPRSLLRPVRGPFGAAPASRTESLETGVVEHVG